jgi:hypothetical protein
MEHGVERGPHLDLDCMWAPPGASSRNALGERRDLGPGSVADHLWANDLTITCTTRTCTSDTPARHAAEQTVIMHAQAAPTTA